MPIILRLSYGASHDDLADDLHDDFTENRTDDCDGNPKKIDIRYHHKMPGNLLFQRNLIAIYDDKITVRGLQPSWLPENIEITEIRLFSGQYYCFIKIQLTDGQAIFSTIDLESVSRIQSTRRIIYNNSLYRWYNYPEQLDTIYYNNPVTDKYEIKKLQRPLTAEDMCQDPLILLIRYLIDTHEEYDPSLVDHGKVIYRKKIEPHKGLLIKTSNYWDTIFICES